MTEKQPTKKQIDILMKNGYNYEQISAMPYTDISAKIGKIITSNKASGTIGAQNSSKGSEQGRETGVETQIHIHRNEKANSYEFGKAGDRFKIYFEGAEDLVAKMGELRKSGFLDEDIEVQKIS